MKIEHALWPSLCEASGIGDILALVSLVAWQLQTMGLRLTDNDQVPGNAPLYNP